MERGAVLMNVHSGRTQRMIVTAEATFYFIFYFLEQGGIHQISELCSLIAE